MSADLLRGLFLFGKKRFFIFFGISLCSACGDIVSGGGAEAAYFGCENDEKNWYDNCKCVLRKKESESDFICEMLKSGVTRQKF